jgi:5-methyltetrahydrofolate--homocysteine methyltransferase
VEGLKESQRKLKESYELSRGREDLLPLAEARANPFPLSSEEAFTPKPPFTGARTLASLPIEEVARYIDWSPFFWTWELKGKYPAILNHPVHGAEATRLFEDAKSLLDRIIREKRFDLKAVYGYFPVERDGDDLRVAAPNGELRFHFLRQQKRKAGNQHYYSLADFIPNGRRDWIGGFCVTAGDGVERFADTFKKEHDDYSSILVKAIGDRLAEAAAEWLHERARKEIGVVESHPVEKLIEEAYDGIRPALGYPACPDHSEKKTLWKLLSVEREIGVELTSSFAMNPPSSVSGLYFFHPEARYFNVGPLSDEQLNDYARRKGVSPEEIRRTL